MNENEIVKLCIDKIMECYLQVNMHEWDSLTEQQQNKVKEILFNEIKNNTKYSLIGYTEKLVAYVKKYSPDTSTLEEEC